jgi:hypothetical protein
MAGTRGQGKSHAFAECVNLLSKYRGNKDVSSRPSRLFFLFFLSFSRQTLYSSRETSSNAPSSADGPGQDWILGALITWNFYIPRSRHERALGMIPGGRAANTDLRTLHHRFLTGIFSSSTSGIRVERLGSLSLRMSWTTPDNTNEYTKRALMDDPDERIGQGFGLMSNHGPCSLRKEADQIKTSFYSAGTSLPCGVVERASIDHAASPLPHVQRRHRIHHIVAETL